MAEQKLSAEQLESLLRDSWRREDFYKKLLDEERAKVAVLTAKVEVLTYQLDGLHWSVR